MEKIEIDIGMKLRTLRLNGESKPYFHKFRTVEAIPISQLPKVGDTFTVGTQTYRWTEGFIYGQEEEQAKRDLPPGFAVEICKDFYVYKTDRGYCGKLGKLNVTPKFIPEDAVKMPPSLEEETRKLSLGAIEASKSQPIIEFLENYRKAKDLYDKYKEAEEKIKSKGL